MKRNENIDPEEFKRLWENGTSSKEIARSLGILENTIWYYRQKYGLSPRKLGGKKTICRKVDVDLEEFKKLFNEGVSLPEICRCFGISRNKYYKIRKELDLPERKAGRKSDNPLTSTTSNTQVFLQDEESLYCDGNFLEELLRKSIKKEQNPEKEK